MILQAVSDSVSEVALRLLMALTLYDHFVIIDSTIKTSDFEVKLCFI